MRGQAGDGVLDAAHCSVIAVCVACQVLRVNLLLVPCESHLTWAGIGPSLQPHADFPSDTDHKQWTVAVVFMDGVSAVISFDFVISEGCMGGINERMLYE